MSQRHACGNNLVLLKEVWRPHCSCRTPIMREQLQKDTPLEHFDRLMDFLLLVVKTNVRVCQMTFKLICCCSHSVSEHQTQMVQRI